MHVDIVDQERSGRLGWGKRRRIAFWAMNVPAQHLSASRQGQYLYIVGDLGFCLLRLVGMQCEIGCKGVERRYLEIFPTRLSGHLF